MADLVSGFLGFLFSLAILSYLIGDNPVYRLAVHLFIGMAAGYAVIVAYYGVIEPQIIAQMRTSLAVSDFAGVVLWLVGLALGLLLLLKSLRVASRLGSLVVAVLVGVGAAVAVGGALTGTLLPQTSATFLSLAPPEQANTLGAQAEHVISVTTLIVGTLASLGYFYYGGRAEPGSPVDRPGWIKPIAVAGQLFIGTAFGVMYAGALVASLAVFAERAVAMGGFIQLLVSGR